MNKQMNKTKWEIWDSGDIEDQMLYVSPDEYIFPSFSNIIAPKFNALFICHYHLHTRNEIKKNFSALAFRYRNKS